MGSILFIQFDPPPLFSHIWKFFHRFIGFEESKIWPPLFWVKIGGQIFNRYTCRILKTLEKQLCLSFSHTTSIFFFEIREYSIHLNESLQKNLEVIRKNEGGYFLLRKSKVSFGKCYNKKNCLHMLERITFFEDKPTKIVRRVSFSGVSGISYCSNTCSDRSGLSSAPTYDRFGHV